MKDLSRDDAMNPLGWVYQSRIHGNPEGTERKPDEPEDWSQCKHGSWFFLPWHRIYLLQFERIIRSLTGETEWALPYWDYPDARSLTIPTQFLDPVSPLFDSTRLMRPPPSNAPSVWQRSETFIIFGGEREVSPGSHHGRNPGQLELDPHNIVHGRVDGNMASFQSPLDPLFWIHHCNIDRLWEVWLSLPGRTNPLERAWLDTRYEFPDPESGRRSLRVRDIATAETAGYSYDDTTPPAGA
jgi:tyrosinase